jgi:hypothetical protein
VSKRNTSDRAAANHPPGGIAPHTQEHTVNHYALHIESWRGDIDSPSPEREYRMEIRYVTGAKPAETAAREEADRLLAAGRRVCIIRRNSRGAGHLLVNEGVS